MLVMETETLREAFNRLGHKLVAKRMRVHPKTVPHWLKKVPDKHLLAIEWLTGIPRHRIRPDLFEGYVVASDLPGRGKKATHKKKKTSRR
jgi:DNA-binding transcriptional regulator YdaS (Cro superfamily)